MEQTLSKYLSYKEVTKSITAIQKGIKNIPNMSQLTNITLWANNIFDPCREFINAPLGVHTVFRCEELNTEIGGSSTSQHMATNGAAGDIDCDIYGNGTNGELFKFILDNLNFDQLIWEFGNDQNPDWIHVSYVNTEKNRKQALVGYHDNMGKTKYKLYEKQISESK